ncbi:MAG TPA: pyrroline-5-carboxylate reductase [Candidatus Krumholzibacteria bacterium]|nr:pyrroline-5-carboxylate reductase [Candidatus Krumholzibacteria bacterium]
MNVSILGAGNIGGAIARGLLAARPDEIGLTLTRRDPGALAEFDGAEVTVSDDNAMAVAGADVVFLCVQPAQVRDLIDAIRPALASRRPVLASVVTNVTLDELAEWTAVDGLPLFRVMPNTAVAVRESMTCVSSRGASDDQVAAVVGLMESVGRVMVIRDDLMNAATALCACGIAFAMRFIRATSQGGTEIGFHADEAMAMAAQTIKGAATLVTELDQHPESAIDRVTTPMGCTIAGLNEMEYEGFSSAAIRGIRRSHESASQLEH